MKNQRGVITLDFIFSFMLVMGLVIIFFGITLTLSVIQVVQYISFSTARTYYAGNFDNDHQLSLAAQKYEALKNDPRVSTLFSSGWFQIDAHLTNKQAGNFNGQYNPKDDDRSNTFEGVQLNFEAKILEYRIPIFGATYTQEDGFVTKIGSYLMREPNVDECENFNRQRFSRLLSIDDSNARIYASGVHPTKDSYKIMSDNGC